MSNEVINKVPEAVERLIRELTIWTGKSGDEIRKQIIAQGDLPKTGVKHGNHKTSSAPGESWANQSGELGKSFTKETMLLRTTLGSTLARAALETGIVTKDGEVTIQARPTEARAIAAALPTIENLLQEACRRAEEPAT